MQRMIQMVEPEIEIPAEFFRRPVLETERRETIRRERIEVSLCIAHRGSPSILTWILLRSAEEHVLKNVRDARVIEGRRPHANYSHRLRISIGKPEYLRTALFMLERIKRSFEISRRIFPQQAETVDDVALCHKYAQLLFCSS